MSLIEKFRADFKRLWRRQKADVLLGVMAGIFAVFLIISPAMADIRSSDLMSEMNLVFESVKPFGFFPEAPDAEPRRTFRIPITAYSSEPWQTDDTPFITASQTHVRDGVVAANFLPIGTRVRVPELYGEKIFVVEDRMNKRYFYKMDIWMAETAAAKQFGVKYATIEVF